MARWCRRCARDHRRHARDLAREHPHFRIATDGDRGVPVGIDVRRVVETGITPVINMRIAGRRAGTGQVGAGTVRAPLGCFTAALGALARVSGVA